MTLLSLIQELCGELAQPVPATVFGSSDKAIVQFLRLLETGQEHLSGRGQWQELTAEYTFTTIASGDQGNLATTGLGLPLVALAGYRYLLPQTLWDRTSRLPLIGAMDPQDWQAMKAWIINGPQYQFRLRGNRFLVNPAPAAGLTWAFEFVSKNFAATAAGVTINRFTADDNVLLLPEQIVKTDLKWRWKEAKGLPYAQDFENSERLVADALGRNQPQKTLHMDRLDSGGPRPMIVVAPGNWPL